MPLRFRGLKLSGKTGSHLKSMIRTQVTQLIEHERIETTLPKAKILRRFADKMVTLGKKGTKWHYNVAASFIRDYEMVDKLFEELAPRYKDRYGGYTRVLRTRIRRGDGAQMALIEYIDRPGEIRKPLPPRKTELKKAKQQQETVPVVEAKLSTIDTELTAEELAEIEKYDLDSERLAEQDELDGNEASIEDEKRK
mmetsp:Transcript_5627/g.8292  ORF Transcript_5627/g.8292 Transcript_5627/m.8292 type:complete len:196 (+) Transcript_5627:34-621(+)